MRIILSRLSSMIGLIVFFISSISHVFFPLFLSVVSATFFGPNSEYVVSGSDDGFFYVWDRESEGIVQWLHADADGAVNVIESHPSLPVLASAGLDFDFKVCLFASIRCWFTFNKIFRFKDNWTEISETPV